MAAVRRGTVAREIQYVVWPDSSDPLLLARVRWPDVFQAISAAEPDWREDPGLCDLPYDPSSRVVTPDQAAAIATEWGARLPAADEVAPSGPLLLRRMPANWSDPSKAEKRAWSMDSVRTRHDPAARKGLFGRWRRRDRDAGPAPELAEPSSDGLTVVLHVDPADVIDLTDARDGALTAVDDG